MCIQRRGSTHHENDRGCTGKHILSADGTIALQVALDALVIVLKLNVHTDITLFAMKVVSSKPLPDSADPTVVAMIDVFLGVVVPELAGVAVVDRHTRLAGGAGLGSLLDGLAVHTEHHLGLAPDNDMITGIVVTEPAVEPSPAAVCL